MKRAERSAADSQDQRLRRTNTRAAHTHGTTEQLCVVASSRVRRHCTANTGNADHWRECSPAVAPCTRGTLQYTAVVGMTEATARVDSVSQKKVSGLCWAEKRSTHAWPGLLRAAWLKAAVVPSSIYNDINLGFSLLTTMMDHLVWRLNHCLGTYRRLRWFELGFCGGLLRGPVTKWH